MQSQSQRPTPIPENHPLRRLSHAMTEASFEQVGMPDMELMIYVTGVLIDFVHVDNLYRIRDAQGRRLEYLFELQQERDQGDATHAREAKSIWAIMLCLCWRCFPSTCSGVGVRCLRHTTSRRVKRPMPRCRPWMGYARVQPCFASWPSTLKPVCRP